MSDHSKVLVPIETWAYGAPDVSLMGKFVDIGLLAEALIYYDQVIFTLANQEQMADLVRWFWDRHYFPEFLGLLSDGTFKFCEYSFASAPLLDSKTGHYILMNVQGEDQKIPGTFEKRFLYHHEISQALPRARHREQLIRAFRERVFEEKADNYGSAIENAREDYTNAERVALILQALVDEAYRLKNMRNPPKIEANIQALSAGKKTVSFNINFNEISRILGEKIHFHNGIPLAAAASCNRFLLTSSIFNCDLYLPNPMSILVGDKLYESNRAIIRPNEIIENLQEKVEFPDIRHLINSDQIPFREILKIRTKANKFRNWLQTEADRDRDALIAYHNEIGKELGLEKAARKTLNLFGKIGGPAVGAAVGTAIGGMHGAVTGSLAGASLSFVSDLASKLGANWKPVIFGNWLEERISNYYKKVESKKRK